jgi:hypothetical protein
MRRRRTILWAAALTGLFAFRLLFGLSLEFFTPDQTQIFLMGLRYHASGAWPYFGPDVVWTMSEIPGALQALLVGVPLDLVPVPEAPFVLLNVLSTSALAVLAWYVHRRLPSIPSWLVCGWFLTIPWTLGFSTHINNSSFVLPASVVFFLGFFEAVPSLTTGTIPPATAHALMGVAVAWTMQLHMSWPLLLPYALSAWVSRYRDGARALSTHALAFTAGTLIPGALLVPTLAKYGLSAGSGGALRNLRPHWVNPAMLITVLARFFSFSSLEIARFLELDTARRLDLLARHWWLAPLGAVVWCVGTVQPLWMLREWFRSAPRYREWPTLKGLVAGTVVLVYASYWFVIERATEAHAFYVLLPVSLIFAAYCWTFLDSPAWRRRASAILVLNIAYHAGLAWARAPAKSLYRNREVVAAAIRMKQPEMFGHRRPFAIDGGPLSLRDSSRPFDPRRDLDIGAATFAVGPRGLVRWTVSLTNRNPRVAFRDVVCETTYRGARGEAVLTRRNSLTDILEPMQSRRTEVNDGFVPPFTAAAIAVIGGEALLPTTTTAARQEDTRSAPRNDQGRDGWAGEGG